MSNTDQCPSTKGKLPAQKSRAARNVSSATGRAYWRSLDDLTDSREFRDRLEREFPAFASELDGDSRRDFMKIMGAGLAVAGAVSLAGCRRPDHKILAYNRKPEDIIPGNPLYFATALPGVAGVAQGVLARTIDGRPVKIEGNPLHPINQGRTDVYAQAAVLDLYDPDRGAPIMRNGEPAEPTQQRAWRAFDEFASSHFAKFDQSRGAGLFFLVNKSTSPTREDLRNRLLTRWPGARWLAYEPCDTPNTTEGSRLAFGSPHRQVERLANADVILSVGRDFLGEPGNVDLARGYASGRRLNGAKGSAHDAEMNRVYCVESMMSLTGGAADHRLRIAPADMPAVALRIAQATLTKLGQASLGSPASGEHDEWIDAVAEDLVQHRGRAVTLVGEGLPAPVHAAFHMVNAALAADRDILAYVPMTDEEAASSLDSINELSRAMSAGRVDTLVVIDANPVYDAPADLDFASKYRNVRTTMHLGLTNDETGAASTWRLSLAHPLESWGDARAKDGTISAIQPMIAPLFEARTDLEFLARISGDELTDAYDLVHRVWRARAGGGFDKAWKRALHDGFLAGSTPTPARPRANGGAVRSAAQAMSAPASQGLAVVFEPSAQTLDGRMSNNAWMQELPHPVTKITWDNPALISPATAERLGLSNGDMANLTLNGATVKTPVWIQPGLTDDTVVCHLGYGRTTGRVATGVGFNFYPLRRTTGMHAAQGGSLEKAGGSHMIATTQDHGSMEGRAIIREVDLAAYRKHADADFTSKDSYGYERRLDLADALGTESHTPANKDIYLDSQGHDFETVDETGKPRTPPAADRKSAIYQWGMSIDLTTCTGCNACVVACQSENNIPVIGKREVWKGREMSWIRVDRYYADHDGSGHDVDMAVQPVACVHCENAPCEVVCPVNATIHGAEGTNDMAYNRCIGTRYCANNCPYKVRRFNWFDYATKEPWGGFGQLAEGVDDELMPTNQNLVPPRLRAKVSEVRSMQYNPHVTVRSRGVMEKCTYCMQRINRAKIDAKLLGMDKMPDGFFQTACQQACPTDSIVFGDVSDSDSRVTFLRDHPRSYMLLGYLNTRPRTTHMLRVRNPNPRLRAPVADPPQLHHGAHGDEHHGDAHHDEGHVMRLNVLPQSPDRRRAIATAIKGALS